MSDPIKYEEDVMTDDMNVFIGYLYVCDGKVVKSHIEGDIRTLKLTLGVKEVRRCNINKRDLWDEAEEFDIREHR
jgi:hypothetical protein